MLPVLYWKNWGEPMRTIEDITEEDITAFNDAIFALHKTTELNHLAVIYILCMTTARISAGLERALEFGKEDIEFTLQ